MMYTTDGAGGHTSVKDSLVLVIDSGLTGFHGDGGGNTSLTGSCLL